MRIGGFTKTELRVLELRVSGVSVEEIAKKLGMRRKLVSAYVWKVKRKAGVDSLQGLKEWAIEWGFDMLGPETPEEQPYTEKTKAAHS